MEIFVGKNRLEIIKGDITRQDTEAIVNAANSALLGGGGVDGAIHRAGGPEILEECRLLGGCPTGEARLTKGGNLKASYVIHTVGPVYKGGGQREREELKNAYLNSLLLASEKKIRSISFPSISTGAYSYPVAEAAEVALGTVYHYLKVHREVDLVRFVLFGEPVFTIFKEEAENLIGADIAGE